MNYIVYMLYSIKVTSFSFLHNFNCTSVELSQFQKTKTLHLCWIYNHGCVYIGKGRKNITVWKIVLLWMSRVERIKLSQIEGRTSWDSARNTVLIYLLASYLRHFLDSFSFGKELVYRVIGLHFRIRDRERRFPWINIVGLFLSLNQFLIVAVNKLS